MLWLLWLWLWWWWYRRSVQRACLFMQADAHATNQMDRYKCTGPFGRTDQPVPNYACSLRRQVPGVPNANLTQLQVEEKNCEARHLTPHSYGGGRAQSFSSPRRWMPWVRIIRNPCNWTCLPGYPDPSNNVTTIIKRIPNSNIPCSTTTITNPG